MTASQGDIEDTARLMLRRFGADALGQIDRRISELEAFGEQETAQMWRSIRIAAQALQSDKREIKDS